MKKKQKTAATAVATPPDESLNSVIESHRKFFDHLIELIPAKFYLSNDDADSKPWYQGLSKAAKASLKQQSKENLKLARRNRLDPELKSAASTLGLLHQQITRTSNSEEQNPKDNSAISNVDGDADAGGALMSINLEENIDKNDKAVTYEELRQRLRRKIELLRGNRGASEKKNENKRGKGDEKKRKRDERDGGESGKGVESEKNESEGEEIIEYGKVKIEDEVDGGKKKKKRKMSKANELERAQRLGELKKENPLVAEKESWKAATSRAMGVKIHDDPRLIKESIKKEKRRKDKNAEKWKERIQSQEKMKEERQKKRKENIAGRIHEKKMRKIAKREKKLMRPGFEGRKEGYITTEN